MSGYAIISHKEYNDEGKPLKSQQGKRVKAYQKMLIQNKIPFISREMTLSELPIPAKYRKPECALTSYTIENGLHTVKDLEFTHNYHQPNDLFTIFEF